MCGQSCFVEFTLGEREKEQDRWEEEQKTWADGMVEVGGLMGRNAENSGVM